MKRFTFSVFMYYYFCGSVSVFATSCQTVQQKPGRCVEIGNCPSLYQLSQQKPLSTQNSMLLSLSQCERGRKVCCDVNEGKSLTTGPPRPLRGKVNDFESCSTPNGTFGQCVVISQCPQLSSLLRYRPFTPETEDFLKKARCGFKGLEIKLCCPFEDESDEDSELTIDDPVRTEPVTSDLLPEPGTCGDISIQRIQGGIVAGIDEFPWMALLEYETPNGLKLSCGGSLINNRYVLTAAHCINGKDVPSDWNLRTVRLSEYDISTPTDCIVTLDIEICKDLPVSVEISDKIVHEGYLPYSANQHHDIALLRLVKEVTFTHFIKPICLPMSVELLNADYSGINMTVAGWGKTENDTASNILLKLEIIVQPKSECSAVYGSRVNWGNGQLCAGGDRGKDSCRGDSGGPLMVENRNSSNPSYYVAGIVSFGPGQCGLERWPGVYTKVSTYVSWIVSKLKP